MQKITNKVHRKHNHLLQRMRQHCTEDISQLCPARAHPEEQLSCLVTNTAKVVDPMCARLVGKTASKWGRFEMLAARRTAIKKLLQRDCPDQTLCSRLRCPFKRLKCLNKQHNLSAQCKSTVAAELALWKLQKKAHKRLKKAHKACARAFKKAAGACDEDELSCIANARVEERDCHHRATTAEAHPVVLATDPVTYRHQIVTSPGDPCLEITIAGGNDSPFWKAEGWKYSAPVRPEWKEGACDRTAWKTVDSTEHAYDGYTAAKNSPYAEIVLNKYGKEGAGATALGSAKVQPMESEAVQSRSSHHKNHHKSHHKSHHQSLASSLLHDTKMQIGVCALFVFVLAVTVWMGSRQQQADRQALEVMQKQIELEPKPNPLEQL
jgi:hypothetical protein